MDALPATKRFSLTAHLARAAAERPGYQAPETVDAAETTRTSTRTSTEVATEVAIAGRPIVAAADGARCTSSLMRGQQCARIAPKGEALCTGHAAMAASGRAKG